MQSGQLPAAGPEDKWVDSADARELLDRDGQIFDRWRKMDLFKDEEFVDHGRGVRPQYHYRLSAVVRIATEKGLTVGLPSRPTVAPTPHEASSDIGDPELTQMRLDLMEARQRVVDLQAEVARLTEANSRCERTIKDLGEQISGLGKVISGMVPDIRH